MKHLENKHMGKGWAVTNPSIAITKYWGKHNAKLHLPATPSLAVALSGLESRTEVTILPSSTHTTKEDCVYINGKIQESKHFSAFFSALRSLISPPKKKSPFVICAQSQSNFPVAAGIASSASGFAALALACTQALDLSINDAAISALARMGSASAARSVFGGFTLLPAQGKSAIPLHTANWWPQLRIVVLETTSESKTISSRKAMKHSQETSPFYDSWIVDAAKMTERALEALKVRDLNQLGPIIESSYMRMFATMWGAYPPIRYHTARSVEILELLSQLRSDGVGVWETMDAGPQVKVFCENRTVPFLLKALKNLHHPPKIRISHVAGPPKSGRIK